MPDENAHKSSAKPTTLCWNCARLDCTWMQNLEPVPGWDAIKTDVGHLTTQGYKHLPSYCVLSCPCYTEATRGTVGGRE